MNGAPLAPAERQRLAKVCGLLGSAHDGERASAAVAATAIIRNAGLTWELIVLGGAPEEAEPVDDIDRSEQHTSELQALMRISYARFGLNTKKQQTMHPRQRMTRTRPETT